MGDAEAVVRRFFDRLEDRDVEGALALLGRDFRFGDAAGAFSAGREAMPAMLAWDFEAGSRVDIEALEAEGENVRVQLRERNRFTELLGLEPWAMRVRFVVVDGLILEEVVDDRGPDGSSITQRFERAIGPVAQWAAATRPEEAAAVFEDGRISRYDGPTARRLLGLMESYFEADSIEGR